MKSGIYTRGGDKGRTLVCGERVSKSHQRIEALGSVDELNAVLGLLICNAAFFDSEGKKLYSSIQEDLFIVGAVINGIKDIEIDNERISYLEEHIDLVSSNLVPLENFILPGGEEESAWLHLARTVCRRAERAIVAVNESDGEIPANILVYMNRLSDLLFVQARKANNNGKKDVLWHKHSAIKGH